MSRRGIPLLVFLPFLPAPTTTAPEPTLAGSPESMVRQHIAARADRLAFAGTPVDVARMVLEGGLVPAPGNGDYRLKGVDFAFAHPVLREFVERTARAYRRGCGEPLVVTSLVRPLDRQPSNAHPLSVHPAGVAADLRLPDRPECRRLLSELLLGLEAEGVLDVTEERRPPHLHVAVYPAAYAAYLARLERDTAAAVPGARPASGRGWRIAVPAAAWWMLGGVLAGVGGAVAGQRLRRRRDRRGLSRPRAPWRRPPR